VATEQYSIGYEEGYQDGWNAAVGDAPPKREWVELTDEEIMEMMNYGQYGRIPEYVRNFVDAIESKLKEKNGG
jgi:hypothetical protein